jgi:hypothetical protein
MNTFNRGITISVPERHAGAQLALPHKEDAGLNFDVDVIDRPIVPLSAYELQSRSSMFLPGTGTRYASRHAISIVYEALIRQSCVRSMRYTRRNPNLDGIGSGKIARVHVQMTSSISLPRSWYCSSHLTQSTNISFISTLHGIHRRDLKKTKRS